MKITNIYSDLPQSVIAIYTNICHAPYGIINDKLTSKNKEYICLVCEYLNEHNSAPHILQFGNLSELDHEAFKYASDTLNGYNYSGDAN